MGINELNQKEIALIAGGGVGSKIGACVGIAVGTVGILRDFAAHATLAEHLDNRMFRSGESVAIKGAGVFEVFKYSGIISGALAVGMAVGSAVESKVKEILYENDN